MKEDIHSRHVDECEAIDPFAILARIDVAQREIEEGQDTSAASRTQI
jgi:hypothetical protein